MTESGAIHVVMPQMGESLAEGTIVRWLKAPGDRVARDESLFEISTDKVDTEVPAPAAGVLTSILAREGETVAVGAPVAVIEAEGGDPSRAAAGGVAQPSAAADEPPGHFKVSHLPQLVSFRRDQPAGHAVRSAERPARHERAIVRPVTPPNRSYSPAVLDAARQGGVPLGRLTSLHGSGRGGRVTKRDVQRFLEDAGVDGPASAPAIHATAQSEVDMTATVALLDTRRDAFRERTGAPLTETVMVAAATVRALREYPILNSSVVGDAIAFKPFVNLGVAVAFPDADTLVVTVVTRAEELALPGIARAMHSAVTRAKARQLSLEDLEGGTFTLTSPGTFGAMLSTPILRQPQVGILSLGAVQQKAVVINDAIAVRPVMAIALTFDSRVTDGMVAFRFLTRIRELLEAPPDAWRSTIHGNPGTARLVNTVSGP
ncbi:MAG: dihydrolipoamide acetyltransferase family protein [Vicinamibacterales bacterium]